MVWPIVTETEYMFLLKNIKTIFKKLKIFLGIYNIDDWTYSFSSNKKNKFYKFNKNSKLIPKNETIIIKPKRKIKKGWYLFGIKHFGENRRVFGSLKCGRLGFSQGRPMYPVRRRWRVFRKANNYINMHLKLESIVNPIDIKEIWLIKIPFYEASRRINIRLKEINLKKKNYLIHSKDWKNYNKLLNSQRLNVNLISYSKWKSNIQKKFFNKFISKDLSNNILFNIQYEKDLTLENNAPWVVILESNSVLIKNFELVLRYILSEKQNAELIYGDEDNALSDNPLLIPQFKPSWNRELFLSDPSYSSCWIVKKDLYNDALKTVKNNFSIHKIVLEIIYKLELRKNERNIIHLPIILCSNNKKSQINRGAKNSTSESIFNHITKYKNHYGIIRRVEINKKNYTHKLIWETPKNILISILIPTKDNSLLLRNCIESINKVQNGFHLEIIILNNNSEELRTLEFLNNFESKEIKNQIRKVISIKGEFNYSKINNIGAKHSGGQILIFLNNDTEIITNNFFELIISNISRPGIGCVGGKLLFEDNTIQHAGVILGIGGLAGHAHKYLNKNIEGYQSRISLNQEFSALTGACLAISKKNWDFLNGFNEINLKVNYNDVDLCLRANKLGLRNLYIADLTLYHFESKTRGKPIGKAYRQWRKEYSYMKKKWGYIIDNDPCYSPNLSKIEENFSYAIPQMKYISPRSYLMS